MAAGATGFYLNLFSSDRNPVEQRKWSISAGLIGLVSLLLAGVPYWVARLPITLTFPNDRFTLSYLLGSSLFVTALLTLISSLRSGGTSSSILHAVRNILVAVLVAGAVNTHLLNAVEFRRDWNLQRSFFWQLSWRIPDLQPATTVFSNELPIRYCSDNSLTAPLNWMYAPDQTSGQMQYLYYYPTVRLGAGLPLLEKGLPIQQDYLATSFSGRTSQMVGIYYRPPACLRVVDAELDGDNWMLPPHLREAAHLSTAAPILTGGEVSRQPPAKLFGSEPVGSWCYYFQKADLARQQKDWEAVVQYGALAFQTGDYPNDPAERFPFIEGYAHTGQWQRAVELTQETYNVTDVMAPLLCRLWNRIERDTLPSSERDQTLAQVRMDLDCLNR
jgi:hypothetical protein